MTVEIPLAQLARVEPAGFDRLVPGLREELLTALLRSLPKPIRRNVVPAAEWARRLGAELTDDPGTPLTDQLADAIRRATHVTVTGADFDLERVPAHLRMTFAAVDDRGKRVGTDKDLGACRRAWRSGRAATVAAVTVAATPGRELERTGLTAWDFGELPERIERPTAGATSSGYPALVDEGTSVAIRVFATPAEQRGGAPPRGPTPAGARHPDPDRLRAGASERHREAPARDESVSVGARVARRCAARRDRRDDRRCRARHRGRVRGAADPRVGGSRRGDLRRGRAGVPDSRLAREADRAISGASSMALMAPLADARAQLAALIHPGFVRITGITALEPDAGLPCRRSSTASSGWRRISAVTGPG